MVRLILAPALTVPWHAQHPSIEQQRTWLVRPRRFQLVQEITSRFAGDELIVNSGWELESIDDGKSDPTLFEIPKDYREGSMLQFASEFGSGSASNGLFNQPADPYDQMKAPRPAP